MKKLLALLMALALMVPAGVLAEEDNSLQYILDKGTFVLGFDSSFPPMGFTDDEGEYIGFDIDRKSVV